MKMTTIGHIDQFKNIALSFDEKEAIFSKLSKIIKSDSRVTLGVSAGPDSMFMAVLVYTYFWEHNLDTSNISLAHCNHKIRKESEKEQQFVENFFKSQNFFVFQRTSDGKKDENSLRKRRHGCFENITIETKSEYLLLGHNLTDRVETTFLNLLRGASLNGFVGMNFVETKKLSSDYVIVRPVLDLSKQYITDVCDKFGIPYFIDQTNLDPKTSKRNKLRLEILPLIYKLSNKKDGKGNTFLESFRKIYGNIEKLKMEKGLVGSLGNIKNTLKPIKLSRYWETEWGYEWTGLRGEMQMTDLVGILKELQMYGDVGTAFLEELLTFVQTNNDGYKYFNGVYIFIAHDRVYLIKGPKLFWEKEIDEEMKITEYGNIRFGDFAILVKEKKTASQVELLGSTLRFPKAKDTFKGKNINKYLLNKKVPIFWRNFRPVFVQEGKIVRVV